MDQSYTLSLSLSLQALQQLSNGKPVPYGSTLRIVVHEGSRAPLQPAQKASVWQLAAAATELRRCSIQQHRSALRTPADVESPGVHPQRAGALLHLVIGRQNGYLMEIPKPLARGFAEADPSMRCPLLVSLKSLHATTPTPSRRVHCLPGGAHAWTFFQLKRLSPFIRCPLGR